MVGWWRVQWSECDCFFKELSRWWDDRVYDNNAGRRVFEYTGVGAKTLRHRYSHQQVWYKSVLDKKTAENHQYYAGKKCRVY